MNTLEFRDKMRHFLAVNQINLAEFKHLAGTIMLFISVGGVHKIMLQKMKFNQGVYEIAYYSIVAFIGISLYLKII
jgi:hypothetical protein